MSCSVGSGQKASGVGKTMLAVALARAAVEAGQRAYYTTAAELAARCHRARVDKPDPLEWIETHPVRSSPFWRTVRLIAEGLEPDLDAPWYARFAWVNLYPAAPENPPGNPGGALKEAQDPHVGRLLRAVTDMLDAKRVIAMVGPFWWPAAGPAGLADLPEHPRPLLRAGRSGGRTWVISWHPNGASHRGVGPRAYADIIVNAVAKAESQNNRELEDAIG